MNPFASLSGPAKVSRRRLLRQATVAAAAASLGAALPPDGYAAEPKPSASPGSGTLSVRDFDARGDGKKDDTAAFAEALKTAGKNGGGLVTVPRGNYLINETLEIPEHVTLEGVFRAPTARTQNFGSTLLATAGADKPDGQPFITLRQNATLHGLTIFYPEQKMANPPTPYPWTVRGIGDNCSLIDVQSLVRRNLKDLP